MPRKNHKYHYIYKITNLKNNKYYIGMHSTSNLDDGYMGGGKRIGNSIRKHGKENHIKEILEYLSDRISLAEREKVIVDKDLLKDPLCMNIVTGGYGNFTDELQKELGKRAGARIKYLYENDKEWREKRIAKHSSTAKRLVTEGKIKLPDWTGKKHSDETKEKIGYANSINQTGEKNSQFGTCWINNIESGDKKIKKEYLYEYLLKGWERGRQK